MIAAAQGHNQRGIAAMVASQAAFVASDCIVKLAAASMPASEIMVLRGAFATAGLVATIAALGVTRQLGWALNPYVALRAFIEAGLTVAYLAALPRLRLGVMITVTQAAPFFLTMLAIVIEGAEVGWRRWLAIAVGFVGVLLVSKPDVEGFAAPALLALLCAFLIACRDLVTRRIGGDVPSLVIATASVAMAIPVGGTLSLGEVWHAPSLAEAAMLFCAALFVTCGYCLVILAIRNGEVAVIGPFRYAAILFGLIAGNLIWGERPDAPALLGAGLIVLSGIYTLHRERARARFSARPSTHIEPLAQAER
jgi:drug/metabolite transporter (DMT)-like permease